MAFSAPARLTINVLDVNDNAPRFRPFGVSNFTEKILEGAQPGTTLLSVSAVDPDKGPNGQVIYQLLHLPRGGYVRLEDPSTGTTTPQLASIVTDKYTREKFNLMFHYKMTAPCSRPPALCFYRPFVSKMATAIRK